MFGRTRTRCGEMYLGYSIILNVMNDLTDARGQLDMLEKNINTLNNMDLLSTGRPTLSELIESARHFINYAQEMADSVRGRLK